MRGSEIKSRNRGARMCKRLLVAVRQKVNLSLAIAGALLFWSLTLLHKGVATRQGLVRERVYGTAVTAHVADECAHGDAPDLSAQKRPKKEPPELHGARV